MKNGDIFLARARYLAKAVKNARFVDGIIHLCSMINNPEWQPVLEVREIAGS